jgi:CheY-like chemotaxis protein
MKFRILVVEDEQIVAADLAAKLGSLGYEVAGIASSGEEAISLSEQLRPELVLMDVRLQGRMDGTEAARRIQRATGVPIVFITAFAEIFLRDPSLMNPPGLCISKPFSLGQLRAVLDTVRGERLM